MNIRRGFVLSMWTGLFPLDDDDLPVIFLSKEEALGHLAAYPSWGRDAVTVYACTVRSNGSGGRPDYILESA